MRGLALMGVLWTGALLGVGGRRVDAGDRGAACSPRRCSCSRSASASTARFRRRSASTSRRRASSAAISRASSISWQIGWIVGPAAGGTFLQHRPLLLWPLAAGVNLVFAAGALALERRLPERVRITPYSAGPQASIARSTG